ncbi:MAG: hypothetical protein AAGA85_03260 [Bacteroidota bacterium]
MKAFFLYYWEVAQLNLPISVGLAVLSMASGAGPVMGFLLSYATAGGVLSVYFHGRRKPDPYYFYQNLGFSKAQIIAGLFGINLSLALLFLLTRLW